MDDALRKLTSKTVSHYEASADHYRDATHHHDVSENIAALLGSLEGEAPFRILDFGCGPGRDLVTLKSLGHEVVGLDACARFVDLARSTSGCDVWLQNFLELSLPREHFDGVFANASLFHVPGRELPRVIGELHAALKPRGVLFCSNPRGPDREGWAGDRYGCFLELPTWRRLFGAAGFEVVLHCYRPGDRPPEEQRWLAMVVRKS